MNGPFKLKYNNTAFPFKKDEDDNIIKLEKSLKTSKSKEGMYPIVNINPETLSAGIGYTKGKFSIGGGYSKRISGPGGGFGFGASLKFGGKK